MDGFISINGVIDSESSARIPANDRFFLFGDGLYEIMAAKGGCLLDFDRHMQRLRDSATSCHINIPWSNEALMFEIQNLLSLVPAERHAIRLIISSGHGFTPRRLNTETTSRYIFCRPLGNQDPMPENGTKLRVRLKKNFAGEPYLKTNSYLSTITAQIDVKSHGFDEILWENAEGEFLEAGFANIFLMGREGDLLEIATPPVRSGILPGVTRARVISLLENAGIRVTERPILREELAKFDEGFLTSSIKGLTAIHQIDNHRLFTLRRNSVFREILRLYNAWEDSQINTFKPPTTGLN